MNDHLNKLDHEEIRQFYLYFNEFYGVNGIYSSGRRISMVEIANAVSTLENWGGGDSLDREKVRDIIFTEEQITKMYS